MDERTCRICRGEELEDDPLFYPCKCRGSIKYIHQGCLEEWLKHSKREPTCDICHEKFVFTTTYRDDTPNHVPLKLLFIKLRNTSMNFLRFVMNMGAIGLGIVVQIPLFWKVSSRVFTWLIDGAMPHDVLLVSLIYGENQFEGDPFEIKNLLQIFRKTYTSSLVFITIFLGIHLLLFLEHEWVSRDPGFKKLIIKNIGQLHAQRIINNRNELFNAARLRANQFGVDPIDPERLDVMRIYQDAVNNLANNPNAIQDANDLIAGFEFEQRARDRAAHIDPLRAPNHDDELLDDENELEDPDFEPEEVASSEEEAGSSEEESDIEDGLDQEMEQGIRIRARDNFQIRRDNGAHFRRFAAEDPVPAAPVNEVPDLVNFPPNNRLHNMNGGFNEARIPIRRPVRDEAAAAAAVAAAAALRVPNNIEEPEGFFQISLLFIILGADSILCSYLFCFYFLPSCTANILFTLANLVFDLLKIAGAEAYHKSSTVTLLTNKASHLYNKFQSNKTLYDPLESYVLLPVSDYFRNTIEHKTPQSTLDRAIPLITFYCLAFLCVSFYLSRAAKKYSNENPLTGIQRTIYIMTFNVVCTLKVFTIFTIELFGFPVYSGFLLEVVLSPFLSYDFPLVLSSVFLVKDHISLRILSYWGIGTIYMCLFALFVGMTRTYILRPGVLFFIRSPEDPNTRLIHDALVRPFGLQISRIAMSGLVYTIFIVLGFGLISFPAKFTDSPLFPLFVNSPFSSILTSLLQAVLKISIVKKYVRQYWVRAFKISAAKLRLSSFILGINNPRERGYVIYRDLNARLSRCKPDFTEPKTKAEALELFKTTDAKCFFIPDGYFVRAPKHDTVSRKFVKNMFIPVTKDDIPLEDQNVIDDQKYSLDEFDDSEDELITTNFHEVVYRPPHFGLRIIGFLCMIWVFACILFAGVSFSANTIGLPFSSMFTLFKPIDPTGKYWWNPSSKKSIFQFDFTALYIGLTILMYCLNAYDDFIIQNHIDTEGGDVPEKKLAAVKRWVQRRFANIVRNVRGNGPRWLRTISYGILSCFTLLNFAWAYHLHLVSIEVPYVFYHGEKFKMETINDFQTSPVTILAHLILILFTILPNIISLLNDLSKVLQGRGNEVLELRHVYQFYVKPFALRLFWTSGVVTFLKLSFASFEYSEHPELYTSWKAAVYYTVVEEKAYEQVMKYAWPCVTLTVVVVYLVWRAYNFYEKMNEAVKEEFYAQGKTLENAAEIEASNEAAPVTSAAN